MSVNMYLLPKKKTFTILQFQFPKQKSCPKAFFKAFRFQLALLCSNNVERYLWEGNCKIVWNWNLNWRVQSHVNRLKREWAVENCYYRNIIASRCWQYLPLMEFKKMVHRHESSTLWYRWLTYWALVFFLIGPFTFYKSKHALSTYLATVDAYSWFCRISKLYSHFWLFALKIKKWFW